MMGNKKFLIFFIFFVCAFLLEVNFVFALEINYPRLPGAEAPQDFISTAPAEEIPSLYVRYIFALVIWISGLIVFGALVYAGISYLISAGKPESLAAAKEKVLAAFFGLLLLLSSYLVLKILNPQLIVLEKLEVAKPEIIKAKEVPPPETKQLVSLIDTEIPFSRIIEQEIFETYVPPGETRKPKMEQVKDNASTTFKIAEDLEKNSKKLKEKTGQCKCSNAKPCCEISSPGPGCTDNVCRPKPGCTCDPCKNVRSDIENLQKDIEGDVKKLIVEQEKSQTAIQFLTDGLERLKRAENFIADCPVSSLKSLTKFFIQQDFFESMEQVLRKVNLWEDINIVYYNQKGQQVIDRATFYCISGGTILTTDKPIEPEETLVIPEETTGIGEERVSCIYTEVMVGEIIDRTKRMGYLLIERLEDLVELDKDMAEAISELEEAVGECSSQKCYSDCYLDDEGYCHKECTGKPCPDSKISEKYEKVKKIQQDIKNIIENQATTTADIGILTIAEQIVPKILEDLELYVRQPMQLCSGSTALETELNICEAALGAIDPTGEIIRTCCLKEGKYQECLEECYLSEGKEKYKECLRVCFKQKTEELKQAGDPLAEYILGCRHRYNFYCCQP